MESLPKTVMCEFLNCKDHSLVDGNEKVCSWLWEKVPTSISVAKYWNFFVGIEQISLYL